VSIYIKNTDSITRTWHGKQLNVNEYHLIQPTSEVSWANNEQLLIDIANGKATVAKDDSGSKDITNINEAINYLKNNLPTQVKTIAVNEPDGKRARLVGVIPGTTIATANTTTSHDYLIPQLQYEGQNVNSIFDGIQYFVKDSEMGDKMTFQVVDKDGFGVLAGWYDQATFDAMGNLYVVEEFGKDWNIAPNHLENIVLYKARLISGLYLRVNYTNVHATKDTNFFINLFRHIES